jgi:hypothetical protein
VLPLVHQGLELLAVLGKCVVVKTAQAVQQFVRHKAAI